MDRAGTALRNAAAVFGTGQPDLFADDPEQRCVRLNVNVTDDIVYRKPSHEASPMLRCHRRQHVISPAPSITWKTYRRFVAQMCRGRPNLYKSVSLHALLNG
jgi:hypothetical protein